MAPREEEEKSEKRSEDMYWERDGGWRYLWARGVSAKETDKHSVPERPSQPEYVAALLCFACLVQWKWSGVFAEACVWGGRRPNRRICPMTCQCITPN